MDMVAYKALASQIRPMIARGVRRILVTSSGPREGKSTVAANLSRALASSGKFRVVLVDADLMRPTLHELFGVGQRRGLTELLIELYQTNMSREQRMALGLGDWIDLARAQSRTGTLHVSSDDQSFQVAFDRGRIASISSGAADGATKLGNLLVGNGRITNEQRDLALRIQQQGQRRIGEVLHSLGSIESADLEGALMAQVRGSIHQLVTLAKPTCLFTESSIGFGAGVLGEMADSTDGGAIDHFVAERFGDYLSSPYLTSQIPGYFANSGTENLTLLTRGQSDYDIADPAFGVLLGRLSRMFDVVIVDSPPVAVTSPAVGMASHVQGVLFIVKSEGYDLRIIQQAKGNLQAAGANLLGVVLNQVNVKSDPYVAYYYGAYKR